MRKQKKWQQIILQSGHELRESRCQGQEMRRENRLERIDMVEDIKEST